MTKRGGIRSRLAVGALVVVLPLLCGACGTLGKEGGRAKLVGALWWVSPEEATQPIEAWREELNALEALGMDLVVLNGPFVGDAGVPERRDPMQAFFDETDRRHFRVFLDTGTVPNWWTLNDPSLEIERAAERIRLLDARYGRHPSFAGYYVPYEIYAAWDGQAELVRRLYAEVSARCKEVAPRKPVMISPFFILDDKGNLGDFRWATPEEYQRFWADTLSGARIDILALQDSGEHLSCYTNEQRAPFFAAMKAACDAAGVSLWANIESGQLEVASVEDYVARFGLKTHVNDPKTQPYWRGVPAGEFVGKLAFVRRFTPTSITWGYREFLRPRRALGTTELYLAYQRALNSDSGEGSRRDSGRP